MKRECGYRGWREIPDCPPCEGDVRWCIRHYFTNPKVAEARGSADLWLCDGHRDWLASLNPLHRIELAEGG